MPIQGTAINYWDKYAFIVKIAPDPSAVRARIVYAGYIGGSSSDGAFAVDLSSDGSAYLAGFTESSETTFPVLSGPGLQHRGRFDAFVARVAPGGTGLLYAG